MFKIENLLVVVVISIYFGVVIVFRNFQYIVQVQKLWVQVGFWLVDLVVVVDFVDLFLVLVKLWMIVDFGGWGSVDFQLFDKVIGSIIKIYLWVIG